jgi:hypothetical protein
MRNIAFGLSLEHQVPMPPIYVLGKYVADWTFAGGKLQRTRRFREFLAAERARFELAEEREPLAGLANRCLGPLDYLSNSVEFYSRCGLESRVCELNPGGLSSSRVCEPHGLVSSLPTANVGLVTLRTAH